MVAVREQLESSHEYNAQRVGVLKCGSWREEGTAVPQPKATITAGAHRSAANLKRKPRSKGLTSAIARAANQERAAKLRLAMAGIMTQLAHIAFADISDVFDERGAVIPFADLPHGIRSAIAEYRVRQRRNGTRSVCVKLHPKLPALAALMQFLRLFKPEKGRSQPACRVRREHNAPARETAAGKGF